MRTNLKPEHKPSSPRPSLFLLSTPQCTDLPTGAHDRDAVIIILETGFSLGCVVCIILHLLLPFEGTPGDEDKELPDYEDPAGMYDSTVPTNTMPRHRTTMDYNKPVFPLEPYEPEEKAAPPPMGKVEMADMQR
jgi:hypothetical protein